MPPPSLRRRAFLQTAFASVASAGLPRLLRGAAPAGRRPLGFSLYGMKAVPVLDALEHCARIGYRQVELPLLPGFATEPSAFSAASRAAVRQRLSSLGLELSSLMVNLNLGANAAAPAAQLETLRTAAALAHELAPRRPPVIETVLGGNPAGWEALRESFIARLRACAEACAAGDVTLCAKAHVSHAVNSPERLRALHEAVAHPRLALAYDYSHFQAAGRGLEETWQILRPHTRFIHLKDTAPNEKPPRFVAVGEGTIDYAHYFQLLDASGYTGPVVVEVSSQIFNRPGYDGVQAADAAFRVLARALSGAPARAAAEASRP